MWQVDHADILEWAKNYRGPKFHASLGDWPYELSFMNRKWDASGISFQVETWAALAEHLYPGAFIMAFGGSRTYHRLAVAAEDAGLIIHPAIGWLQAQGFPKSTRIDTQIDKAAGAEREVVGRYVPPNGKQWNLRQADDPDIEAAPGTFTASGRRILDIEAPATPLAAIWQGHRYGLQALKPCLEFVLVAQKPYAGKPVESIVATGAGSLWVDGARVATDWDTDPTRRGWQGKENKKRSMVPDTNHKRADEPKPKPTNGRWPPNFALIHNPPTAPCPRCHGDGCPACHGRGLVGGCQRVGVKRVKTKDGHGFNEPGELGAFDDGEVYGTGQGVNERTRRYVSDGLETCEAWHCTLTCPNGHHWTAATRGPCPECGAAGAWTCPVAALGEQGGERKSGAITEGQPAGQGFHNCLGRPDRPRAPQPRSIPASTGSCTRFYPQFAWSYEVAEQLAGAAAVRYCPKAARGERDAGLDGQMAGKTPGNDLGLKDRVESGRVTNVRTAQSARNPHPTVKPISLLVWLARLLAPPPEYAPRRLLVPFSGSGSEMISAVLSGCWETVVGVEMDESYCDIATSRLRWWQGWAEAGHSEPKAILREVKRREKLEEKLRQMEMAL